MRSIREAAPPGLQLILEVWVYFNLLYLPPQVEWEHCKSKNDDVFVVLVGTMTSSMASVTLEK